MCTVTLEYNPNNALARRKLAALLATGLFIEKEIILEEPTPEEVDTHRAEMQAFLTLALLHVTYEISSNYLE